MTSFDFGGPIDMPHTSLRAVLVATVSALSLLSVAEPGHAAAPQAGAAAGWQTITAPQDLDARRAGPWRYRNSYTDRCLAVHGPSDINGGPAYQYDCNNNYADQFWNVVRYSGEGPDARYWIRNANTGRCLAVQGTNNVNGAAAYQYDCTAYEDQAWIIEDRGRDAEGHFLERFRNSYTDRCLAVSGANNVNGARAFQYDCLDQAEDQLWFHD
ncbi:RICIN domain-containing protein [Amycolatopsis sp. NPDC049868]|uniref:RICIN domain-containing protein n=1 Tax=Amycolatopsis sp. NPDC049868 TaxID=3363934 RepID=UPI0037A6332B